MRLFQNYCMSPSYRPRLRMLTRNVETFDDQLRVFLDDRYCASHILKPVLDGSPDTFYTNGDDERLQRAWARNNGLKSTTSLEDILLAQIEQHRADVLYNLDPIRYGNRFVARLPGSVKRRIAWRAAPSGNAAFGDYDLLVCNFPSILEGYRKNGWRSAYFAPSHDPETDTFALRADRPVDVIFVGGYSRHHQRRATILEAVARLRHRFKVVYHLDRSQMTRLAESPFGLAGPLRRHRRPQDIVVITSPPVYGRDLYSALSSAKIVLNGAVDMAGRDRGNLRCFEAMGCGAMLLSDDGIYPEGLIAGETLQTYGSAGEAVDMIERLLAAPDEVTRIARAGHFMMESQYSKELQWQRFQELV